MRLESLQVYRYDLPMDPPLALGGEIAKTRSGLLVRVINSYGDAGYGDTAPLPGFSSDTLDDAITSLETIAKSLLHKNLKCYGIANWFAGQTLCPSARFGMESALESLTATQAGQPASDGAVLPICGLITQTDDLREARELVAAGYRTLKVKVGRRPPNEELAYLVKLRETLGDEITLRLDANRAWSLPEAIAFANGVAPLRIAYLEEPLQNHTDLAALSDAVDFPLALDESLTGIDPQHFTPGRGVAAFVLKPTVLGGLSVALAWVRRARDLGITPVISGAFECGVGLAALVRLAASAMPAGVAAGLDTYTRLGRRRTHQTSCGRPRFHGRHGNDRAGNRR